MSEPQMMKQWSSAEVAKPAGQLCSHHQWTWPYKPCNCAQGHDGDHCCLTQCGTQLVRTWWSREPPL
jgi:hypothetical protein